MKTPYKIYLETGKSTTYIYKKIKEGTFLDDYKDHIEIKTVGKSTRYLLDEVAEKALLDILNSSPDAGEVIEPTINQTIKPAIEPDSGATKELLAFYKSQYEETKVKLENVETQKEKLFNDFIKLTTRVTDIAEKQQQLQREQFALQRGQQALDGIDKIKDTPLMGDVVVDEIETNPKTIKQRFFNFFRSKK